MIFVAEYDLSWENFEVAVAKRLEWDDHKPDDFLFLGEYVWADRDPPFRGVVIFEAEGVDALNAFILHYGPSLKMRAYPASNVLSAITRLRPQLESPTDLRPKTRRKRK